MSRWFSWSNVGNTLLAIAAVISVVTLILTVSPDEPGTRFTLSDGSKITVNLGRTMKNMPIGWCVLIDHQTGEVLKCSPETTAKLIIEGAPRNYLYTIVPKTK